MSAAVRPRRRSPGRTELQMDTARPDGHGLMKLLARIPDGAFASGPDGRIVLWNRAAQRMLGWTAKETIGRYCGKVFAAADSRASRPRRQVRRVRSLAQLSEAVQRYEMKTRAKSGSPIWLDITVLEAPATNGGHPVAIHLLRDLTVAKALLEMVHSESTPSTFPTRGLTKRETEVLDLMRRGANTHAMAERLHVSPTTIRNHAQNIFTKLDVHSRLEAVAWHNQQRLS